MTIWKIYPNISYTPLLSRKPEKECAHTFLLILIRSLTSACSFDSHDHFLLWVLISRDLCLPIFIQLYLAFSSTVYSLLCAHLIRMAHPINYKLPEDENFPLSLLRQVTVNKWCPVSVPISSSRNLSRTGHKLLHLNDWILEMNTKKPNTYAWTHQRKWYVIWMQ